VVQALSNSIPTDAEVQNGKKYKGSLLELPEVGSDGCSVLSFSNTSFQGDYRAL
jgi:hypothetical protein